MDTLETVINNYLEYCSSQKCLDEKTLKAYRIDLRQFSEQIFIVNIAEITSKTLEQYIARLHEQYKPKTVKRKIASVKALFHYLEYKDIIRLKHFCLQYTSNGKMLRLLTRKEMLLEMLLLRNYYLQLA